MAAAAMLAAPISSSSSVFNNNKGSGGRSSCSLPAGGGGHGGPSSLSFPNPSSSASKAARGELQVCCARVGGVEIPNNKRIEFALQYIHGIGRNLSRQILHDLGMENKRTHELTDAELISLRREVSQYMIEADLRRFNRLAIERLKEIRCYRGIRHELGLPCRGQRTRNNCRTLKNKRNAEAALRMKNERQ